MNNLHPPRDERDPLDFVGAPRIQMEARQADLEVPRDERDPATRFGAPRIQMEARQQL